MSRGIRRVCLLAGISMAFLAAAVVAPVVTPTMAQPGQAPANPFANMQGQKSDQPVQIEAGSLEVRDKNKTATFSGNVQVTQGDTIMRCQNLIVFYGQEAGLAASGETPAPVTTTKSTPGMPQGAQGIRRIEARGGVTVITKDQNASGDLGVYDLKSKTITLSGNVTVSQGPNVIHGERVVVDTATGTARVESGSNSSATPGRVRALIQPNKGQNGSAPNFMTISPGKTN